MVKHFITRGVLAGSGFWAGLSAQTPNREVGSLACAGCHAAIFNAYSKTGMAASSGRLTSSARLEKLAGSQSEIAGAILRVTPEESSLRFEFARANPPISFARSMEWFIGSGHVGRNYLHTRDGFLFQAPVSYYSSTGQFDAAPGYRGKQSVELTRPVGAACLQCHASRLQPVAGTENRFGAEPFLEGGVSCERCHGPGEPHVSKAGRGNIVNPAKLAGERRESICAQCHLTGAARVSRLARNATARYQPGDRASDTIAVFVRKGETAAATSATNHFEQFASSACARRAGAKLWCRTCHPVHGEAVPVNEVCRACHASAPHQAVNDGNCTGCHMPRTVTRMGDHIAYTNHSIARRPAQSSGGPPAGGELRPFGNALYDARDLALAYATAGPAARAVELLEKAAATDPRDVAVIAQLAQLYDGAGQEEKALPLYERVLRLDPAVTGAAVNLGGYWMKRGREREAVALWESALRRNPGLMEARLNLAVARFRSGDRARAESELRAALSWEPDHPLARKLLAEMTAGR